MRLCLLLSSIVSCAALQASAAPPSVAADGALRVGVSYIPAADASTAARLYTEEGFEASLARQLGRLTGRPVRLVALPDAEREKALNGGDVDAILARVDAGDAIRERVDVLPTAYESGLSVAMRSDTQVRAWPDLAGKTVCVTQANAAGQQYLHAIGARLKVERAPAQTLADVRTGACDAAIHDAALLSRLFEADNWRKFSATLPAVLPSELVLLLPKKSNAGLTALRDAFGKITDSASWAERRQRWATNVALEVYLDQDAPDCH
ncbi:polar amino acid transport system substrate-binding protein [Pseudochelatococcus lubricantis]|uniref:Polar amino acid transport system substrate-binding protein n=1 Tax=Pseudochelatococcus lubricantis TaxID=1538102 RepID=A0ABX0V5F0_9HYPH|nr:transporter substrate-binding domain-containing protein [Pseudochelatococcus lubricantis]NIJ59690.1 polar amino acid transport system substrate-binding protein [Pseudochelatococcus lubricantis]